MDYDELVAKVIELLQREKRVPYRALKRRFDLDDDYIEDLKDELIYAKKLAVDEENRVLVWVGEQSTTPPPSAPSTPEPISPLPTKHEREPLSYTPRHLAEKILTSRSALEGERKQVTVLFCDLATSTAIAERIGVENMHTLLNRFFELALNEVHRYEGTINQFLGDGFMALFGAPISYGDHAKRGVLSALSLQRTLQEADLGKPYSVECAFRISRHEGYKDSLAQSLVDLGAAAYWQGHFQRAMQAEQEGLSIAREIHEGLQELRCLAYLCLACWGAGHYTQALKVLHEGMTKAKERDNIHIPGRLTNTRGRFHREFGDLASAVTYDQESIGLGRTHRRDNVEISASINLGLDYLSLGQYGRALSCLEPTLERVEREAFGAHRWRWTIRLLMGLAELSYTTGDDDQALRYVEEGLKEAQRTSSQKYIALGWALRGKIAAKLGDTEAAGTELQRAFTLADQLQSPSLLYPIAYDFGHWHERTGKEREAATLYGKAKATIEQMITAVEDDALRSTFLQSALVQEIYERATRLGG